MSGEKSLSARVADLLRAERFDVQKHEDAYSSGIPDLSFAGGALEPGLLGVDGWIELKRVNRPARPGTPVRLDKDPAKFRRQLLWLRRRGRAGGGATYLLAEVGRDGLLFRLGAESLGLIDELVAGLPYDDLARRALFTFPPPLDGPSLARALRWGVR